MKNTKLIGAVLVSLILVVIVIAVISQPIKIGQTLEGKVVKIDKYGAWVELFKFNSDGAMMNCRQDLPLQTTSPFGHPLSNGSFVTFHRAEYLFGSTHFWIITGEVSEYGILGNSLSDLARSCWDGTQ